MKKVCIPLLILLLIGCSNSRITSFWKEKDLSPQTYKNILVVCINQQANTIFQTNMESHLAKDLNELGYHAISATEQYGPKFFDKMDERKIIDKLKNSGFDAAITIILLDKKKEKKYFPRDMYNNNLDFYNESFWGYRLSRYNRLYEPGYYVTETKYFWESNLYNIATQNLIYSSQTESFEPDNSETMAHHYGILIVKHMIKQKVLIDTNN